MTNAAGSSARTGATATPGVPRARLVVAATLANLAVAALVLALAGTGVEGTELALRTTARVSFVWFVLAFVASPLHALRPSRHSLRLVERRSSFGVIFGLSMSMHVGFILRLYELHAPERPPMVTEADFWIGIPGLVLVALLTITSFRALRSRLSATAWRRLHLTGIWVVWTIFLLCLVDSVGRKSSDHPVLAYWSFIVVLLGAMGLRLAAAFQRRALSSTP